MFSSEIIIINNRIVVLNKMA